MAVLATDNDDNGAIFGACGACEAVVSFMTANSNDAAALVTGATAMAALAKCRRQLALEHADSAAACAAVAAAVHANLYRRARVSITKGLAGTLNSQRLIEVGAGTVLVAAMRAHSQRARLQEMAAWALSDLAASSHTIACALVREADALTAIQEAALQHALDNGVTGACRAAHMALANAAAAP